jgi:hypothetical protein
MDDAADDPVIACAFKDGKCVALCWPDLINQDETLAQWFTSGVTEIKMIPRSAAEPYFVSVRKK